MIEQRDPCWPVWQHPQCFADPRWQQLGQQPGRFCQLGAFSSDARTAITQAPDYFVWWYTAKSIGLGIAVGVIGFLIGRATRK